jgi:hypothetical protein
MDHNDLVSLNNKRSSVVQRVVLMRQVRLYLLLNFFNSIFKYDTDGYPMEQLTETAFRIFKIRIFY